MIRSRPRQDRRSPESREKTVCQARTHLGEGDEQTWREWSVAGKVIRTNRKGKIELKEPGAMPWDIKNSINNQIARQALIGLSHIDHLEMR